MELDEGLRKLAIFSIVSGLVCTFLGGTYGLVKSLNTKARGTGLQITGASLIIISLFILCILTLFFWDHGYKLIILGGEIFIWGLYMIITKTSPVFGQFLIYPLVFCIIVPIVAYIMHKVW